MPSSPIRKLAPYADAAVAKGVRVLHLNIGQPDVPSPDSFWQAIAHHGQTTLAYAPSAGMPELRQAVAESYAQYGIDVTASQVMVTTAGSEALSFAIGCTCDPGDEVIVPEPMYANYIGFAAALGVTVVALPTSIENGFRLPDSSEFEKVITPRTKAIIICNPNNPTGCVYTKEQITELGEIAKKNQLFLISDEVYRDFNYTSDPIVSVMSLPGLEANAIMIDSVSKRYSLCGARIGFLVSRNEKVNSAALRFAQARLSPPTLESIGVMGALKTPQKYFDDVRAEYMARRDLVVDRVRAISGTLCPAIDGAFYATVRLPIDDGDRFCQWLLESFEDKGDTVMLAPAAGFYSTPGSGQNEVRIAYVLDRLRLSRAMDCLTLALEQYPGITKS